MLNGVYIHEKLQKSQTSTNSMSKNRQANEGLLDKNVQTIEQLLKTESNNVEDQHFQSGQLVESDEMVDGKQWRSRKRQKSMASTSASCSLPKSQRVDCLNNLS